MLPRERGPRGAGPTSISMPPGAASTIMLANLRYLMHSLRLHAHAALQATTLTDSLGKGGGTREPLNRCVSMNFASKTIDVA